MPEERAVTEHQNDSAVRSAHGTARLSILTTFAESIVATILIHRLPNGLEEVPWPDARYLAEFRRHQAHEVTASANRSQKT